MSSGRKHFIIHPLLIIFAAFAVSLLTPGHVRASDLPPGKLYTVAPGDTLVDIADRFGSTSYALMQSNNLQSPTHIYPELSLVVESLWTAKQGSLTRHILPVGSSILDVSRRAGVTWEYLSEANHVLYPGRLVPGYNLLVPVTTLSAAASRATSQYPIAVSMIEQLPLWTVLRMNPFPIIYGESPVIPGCLEELQADTLPFPLLTASVNTQPLIRGTSAQFNFTSVSALTCKLNFLDQQVPCYEDASRLDDASQYTVLLGLSPLLEPGVYTATLSMVTQTGDHSTLPLSLLITAGRYDYERIDLPADRTSLLDPVRSQAEREKIAALRTLRTPEKLWSLPFDLPLPGSVTSYYGSRRSYGYGFTSYHAGTDFRAQVGVPVSAPAVGTVVLAEPLVVRGNAVILDHGWGVMSGYWHLSRIDVAVGQNIDRGELIGAVGNTGLSTGPHLHWEMWVNGVPVSPLTWVNGTQCCFRENN